MAKINYEKLLIEKCHNLSEKVIENAINCVPHNTPLHHYLTRGLTILENYHTGKNNRERFHGIKYKLICLALIDKHTEIAEYIFSIPPNTFRKDIDECPWKKTPLTLKEVFIYLCKGSYYRNQPLKSWASTLTSDTDAIQWIIDGIYHNVQGQLVIAEGFLCACRHGYTPIVKLLVNYVDPHYKNDYAFRWSFANYYDSIYKLLAESFNKINLCSENYFVFRRACKCGRIDDLKFLFEIGLDIESVNKFDFNKKYCKNWPIQSIHFLSELRINANVKASLNDILLEHYCSNLDLAAVKKLVDDGCDITPRLQQYFVRGCQTVNSSDDIDDLIDPTEPTEQTEPTDSDNSTFACSKNIHLLEYLMLYDIPKKQTFKQMVRVACSNSNLLLLEWLYVLGQEIEIDKQYFTDALNVLCFPYETIHSVTKFPNITLHYITHCNPTITELICWFNTAYTEGHLVLAQTIFRKDCGVLFVDYEYTSDIDTWYHMKIRHSELISIEELIPCKSSRLLILNRGSWINPNVNILDEIDLLEEYVWEFFCKNSMISVCELLQTKFRYVHFETVGTKIVKYSSSRPLVKSATK